MSADERAEADHRGARRRRHLGDRGRPGGGPAHGRPAPRFPRPVVHLAAPDPRAGGRGLPRAGARRTAASGGPTGPTTKTPTTSTTSSPTSSRCSTTSASSAPCSWVTTGAPSSSTPCRSMAPQRVAGVVGIGVPFLPRGTVPPTTMLRQFAGEQWFMLLWVQDPGVAEADMERDVTLDDPPHVHGLATRGDHRIPGPGRAPEPARPARRRRRRFPTGSATTISRTTWPSTAAPGSPAASTGSATSTATGPSRRSSPAPASRCRPSTSRARSTRFSSPARPRSWRAGSTTTGARSLIDGGGHWVHQQLPGAVNDALLWFLSDVTPADLRARGRGRPRRLRHHRLRLTRRRSRGEARAVTSSTDRPSLDRPLQPRLQHGGGDVAPAALEHRPQRVERAAQTVGHRVGVVDRRRARRRRRPSRPSSASPRSRSPSRSRSSRWRRSSLAASASPRIQAVGPTRSSPGPGLARRPRGRRRPAPRRTPSRRRAGTPPWARAGNGASTSLRLADRGLALGGQRRRPGRGRAGGPPGCSTRPPGSPAGRPAAPPRGHGWRRPGRRRSPPTTASRWSRPSPPSSGAAPPRRRPSPGHRTAPLPITTTDGRGALIGVR